MDDDGYALFFIDLPDDRVCIKVPRVPPSMRYRPTDYRPGYQYTCDVAKGYPVNMTYDPGPQTKAEPEDQEGSGNPGSPR